MLRFVDVFVDECHFGVSGTISLPGFLIQSGDFVEFEVDSLVVPSLASTSAFSFSHNPMCAAIHRISRVLVDPSVIYPFL